jgi:2-polyprenyl-6-methoxyphenol hydroxylase-like FAD-dependent oxidoreductase
MHISIIGGGIAGLTTAIALQRAGIPYTLFESAPAIKAVGAGLVLAANAMKGLQKLGVADAIIDAGRELDAFTIYDDSGKVITRTDCKALSKAHGTTNFTIHRAALHYLLLAQLDSSNIQLNKRAIAVQQDTKGVTVSFADGSEHHTDYLIVADGIHSPIRQQLIPSSVPRYAGYSCWRAVISNKELQLEETSETWGVAGRFGIAPLANDKIYWFACLSGPANNPVFKQYTSQDLYNVFRHFHRPIPELIEATANEDLIWNDILDIKPIEQYAFDRILLIGDAAHATTPNMGQGACQAIEDAVVLGLELINVPVVQAFKAFEKKRLSRTHYVINQSRRFGQLAQTQSKPLAAVRNFLIRLTPQWVNQQQVQKIYTTDF